MANDSTRSSESDAQFLIQATFGPTTGSLEELGQTSLQSWVGAQLAHPVGSHREYYRKRVNSRRVDSPTVGLPRSRCAVGSRWHSYALSVADLGKRINITGNKMYVDNAHRSDIDPTYAGNSLPAPDNCTDRSFTSSKECSFILPSARYRCGRSREGSSWLTEKYCQQTCFDTGNPYTGDDCSPGWPSLEFEGFICLVEEELGGLVALGTTESCDTWVSLGRTGRSQVFLNPGIWFSSSPSDSGATMTFQEVRPGVVTFAQRYGEEPCDLGPFVYHGGQYYLSDARLELLQNDLVSPSGGELTTCRAVPRTFLNEGSCQLRAACGALELEGNQPPATFVLNATTFESFFNLSERYVFSVTGLVDAASPCGRRSRWRELDCSSENCSATAMSATDAAAVASAIALEGGGLRDVYVSCESVEVGAVVASGSSYFMHVHSSEYNVYDFTKWVSAHPGGMDPIKQWASRGFQLEFPSWHPMSRFTDAQSSHLEYIGRLGDTVAFDVLPQGLQAAWTVGYESCGSPGEVANDPSLGHHFSFHTDFPSRNTDNYFEMPFWSIRTDLSKTTVWINMALDADDQLRQRAAWALSQILVTSVSGASAASSSSESWLTYYDIFVRNTFGNYRDILMEVTFSPIMGEYLSFRNSRSLDSSGTFPDENYAREIMQLFTIGLWELNLDGTRKTDANGNDVPTYSNDDITSFARVFTGFAEQAPRPNIEDFSPRNFVDPMRLIPDWHDVYPKTDLSGGYLGDGFPLCSDLPTRAFLLEGARYRFVGYAYSGADLLVLSSSSALYASLAQIRLSVELNSSVSCYAEECVVNTLRVVKVGEGYYQYVRPTCVNLYFFNGQSAVEGQINAPGAYQHSSSRRRHTCMDPNAAVAGASCCRGCSNYIPQPRDYDCDNMYEVQPWILSRGCPNISNWDVRKFCQLTCWQHGVPYTGDDCSDGLIQSANVCGYNQERVSFATASRECERLGMHVCEQTTNGSQCGQDGILVWTPNACTVSVEVGEDGRVASQRDAKTKQNPIFVTWANGFPVPGSCPSQCTDSASGCLCPISVDSRAVFSSVPTRSQLLGEASRLRIGAFPPSASATCLAPCDGEVRAYAAGGSASVDSSTVFECDGVYYRNLESVVEVAGHSFRNPPVFALAKEMTGESVRAEEIFAEVEALLDHLFRHPNLPPFVSYRLIQRMVTSNPTPAYVSAVAQAFSTGVYNGETYSGEYGDLGATFAAIVLHPEARGIMSSTSTGKLREPLIKIMHFLRSMEYVDLRGRQIYTDYLDEIVGQWPFWSPSVFNYYSAEYAPAGLPDGLVAPEFEIFTPPFAIQWLNGMLSLVDSGSLDQCNEGFGLSSRTCNQPEGNLSFSVSSSSTAPTDAFMEVSLLLTGGRISDARAFDAALEASLDGDHLKAAMRTVLMSPEFHTEGDPEPAGERAAALEETPPQPDSYKAMVFLFFNGGADTFNLLVPTCNDLYQEYLTVRQNVALSQGQLLGISADSQNCTTFGVHHALPFVRDLYAQGQLAFVTNIGGLVQPTTKADWRTAPQCAGLFSHIDQQNGGMTLKCQVQGVSPRGFGGRLADALAGEDHFTTSFSLAGSATWSQGQTIGMEIIDGRNGAVRMTGYQELRAVVGNVTGVSYGNVYSEEYTRQFDHAVRSSERLGGFLDSAELSTSFDTSTTLARQLHQVARLIATRTQRGAERDLFFVELRGFDTHGSLNDDLSSRFTELNAALEDFVSELRGQGVFESVVLVTSSDFGRTLTSNGAGTDHGWAGNHFVLGGSINGGRIFNEFPQSLLEGNAQDVGRGRLIPQYPWESVMAPIAQWLGAQPSSRTSVRWLNSVFPNLVNFNISEHIISAGSLFVGFDVATLAPTPTPTSAPAPPPTPTPTPSPTAPSTRTLAAIVAGATEVPVASTAGFHVGDAVVIEGGGRSEAGLLGGIRAARAALAAASSGVLVLASGLANHYPIDSSVTLSITGAPTPAPTSVSGGPAAGDVSATGDPHLRNMHGQRFDLMKPGRHVLINIPRGERRNPLLRVQADARRLGGCKDMYFQELNITGSLAEAKQPGGYSFDVSHRVALTPGWLGLGKVELKITIGNTISGLYYLNLYVKHLGRAGFAVGGLLGDDDHTDASTVPEECHRKVALGAQELAVDGRKRSEQSVAVATAE